MPLDDKKAVTGQVALSFVNARFKSKAIRNYAVSDFASYTEIAAKGTSLTELQKTWALYLKWAALADANPGEYSSANGKSFSNSVKFFYTEGGDTDTAPTIVSAKGANTKEAELKGVGQCEYFAGLAYRDLSTPRTGSNAAPVVRKVATKGHNWVLVNMDAKKDNAMVYVDYWLFALGVPALNCVCLGTNSVMSSLDLDMSWIKVIETWNPNDAQPKTDRKEEKYPGFFDNA